MRAGGEGEAASAFRRLTGPALTCHNRGCGGESGPVAGSVFKTAAAANRCQVGSTPTLLRQSGLRRADRDTGGNSGLERKPTGGLEARRLRSARHLLIDQAHGKPAGAEDRAFVGLEPARDKAQQGGLAAAVAPHQPEALSRADLRRHALEEEAPVDAVGDVLQGQHGRPVFCAARARDARAARAPGCATMAVDQ